MRGSFVAPLFLIILGGVLLINNLRPEISIATLIAEYWPYLIIAWGSIRLAEILFLASRNRPLPMRGISGGEWAIILTLSMVGSGFVFASDVRDRIRTGRINMRGLQIFGETFEYPLKASLAVPAKARIIIDNRHGNARIVGTSASQVVVTGHNSIQALDRPAADLIAERVKLEVKVEGDQVIIRTNQENSGGDNRVNSELEIQIPNGASVECRGHYGDFDVSQIQGNLEVNSDNAGVRAQDIGGDARVDLRRSDIIRLTRVKGNVEIKGGNRSDDLELDQIQGQVTVDGQFYGDLDFRRIGKTLRFSSSSKTQTELNVEQLNGRLHMSGGELEAEDIKGSMRLRSRSKDVRIQGFSGPLDIDIERGDVELQPSRAGFGTITAKTSSGNMTLHLPDNSKFDLDASTRKGEVENDYGSALRRQEDSRGGSIRGAVGSGPKLKVETSRGRLTITKGGTFESHFDNMSSPPSPSSIPAVPKPPTVVER